jgi:hypothetical protein
MFKKIHALYDAHIDDVSHVFDTALICLVAANFLIIVPAYLGSQLARA